MHTVQQDSARTGSGVEQDERVAAANCLDAVGQPARWNDPDELTQLV